MGRYLSAYGLCACLALAGLLLAVPVSGHAAGHSAPKSSKHLSRRHRSSVSRPRTHRAKKHANKHRAGHTTTELTRELRNTQKGSGGNPKGSSNTPEVSGGTGANHTPVTTPKLSTAETQGKSPAAESPSSQSPVAKEPPAESAQTTHRKLIFSDEFSGATGASPGSQWGFDTGGGGWGNDELESYTSRPANAELDGQGHLAISALAEKYTGADGITRQYTSARLQTLNTFKFQYGLAEARIQVPAGQGLVAQFWMLGGEAYEQENWPACGEIDTMEVLGSEPNVLNGTLHAPWAWAPTGVQGQNTSPTPLSSGFHTYSVEWEPEKISFMLDGSVYKTVTPADLPAGAPWPFKHPYFLLMDLAVGGEWPGSPNASTHFPARMLVDWVRVWQ